MPNPIVKQMDVGHLATILRIDRKRSSRAISMKQSAQKTALPKNAGSGGESLQKRGCRFTYKVMKGLGDYPERFLEEVNLIVIGG